jgi:hypothetical protein
MLTKFTRALGGTLILALSIGCASGVIGRKLADETQQIVLADPEARFVVSAAEYAFWAGEAGQWLQGVINQASAGDPWARNYLGTAREIGNQLDTGKTALDRGFVFLESCAAQLGSAAEATDPGNPTSEPAMAARLQVATQECSSLSAQVAIIDGISSAIQRRLFMSGALTAVASQ